MFDQEALLECLSSLEGINKIIVGIILVGAINAICITYSVRITYVSEWFWKKEREKLNIQKAKIDKLSPKKEKNISLLYNYWLKHRGVDVSILNLSFSFH